MMRIFSKKPRAEKTRKQSGFAVRGFAAVETDRLLAGWRWDGGYTPSEISVGLEALRAKSRDMAKNNEHFKNWLRSNATNIIGEGFALKSTPHDIIKGKQVLDQDAAKIIEYHWWKFCTWRDQDTHQTYFDYTGNKTESEMDRMNVKSWKRDGEYFIQIMRNVANPYGIAFRVLRPDWCDHLHNIEDTGRGTLIHAGVEKDIVSRRPVAYWFRTIPKNAYDFSQRGVPLVRIPASDIIHGFTQEEEGQPRGIPAAHAVLVKLKMIEEFDKAELTAARDEACTVGSYEAQDDNADESGLVDLLDTGNRQVASALTQSKRPGEYEILPRGYKLNLHTPQHPNREVTAFKKSMHRDVATGWGVEYSCLFNDWAGVSFSSVRAGTIAERDMWIVEQNEYISQCKQVQFLAWLRSFLSLAASGNLPISKIDKFSEHVFRGRRWTWVDPMRDMNAAVIAVANKWRTNTDIAAEMGSDYRDNVEMAKFEQSVVSGDKSAEIPALNNLQVASAVQIVQAYASGQMGAVAAIALLTAAGVPSETATTMIGSQPVKEIQEDEKATA